MIRQALKRLAVWAGQKLAERLLSIDLDEPAPPPAESAAEPSPLEPPPAPDAPFLGPEALGMLANPDKAKPVDSDELDGLVFPLEGSIEERLRRLR